MIVERDMHDHPKTVKLARRLGIHADSAAVLVQRLWGHCEARRTDFLGTDPEDLAAIARFTGKAKVLLDALLGCVWVEKTDAGFVAHGWAEVNKGWLAKVSGGKWRAEQAKRDAAGRMATDTSKPPASPVNPARSTPRSSQVAGQLPADSANGSCQLSGREAGAVEGSGVESTPTVPKGTEESLNQVVETAIHQLNTLFSRPKKRMGQKSRFALEALALDGSLPLDDEHWAALTAFYAVRADYPKERMWRDSPERIAEDLLSEVTKAQTWLASKGIDFGPQRKADVPEPVPHRWQEWLEHAGYPVETPWKDADAPAKREFRAWRESKEAKEEKAA